MSASEEGSNREQIGTTIGGQPIESLTADTSTAEQSVDDELETGREQIGTTIGGQPIESLTYPDTAESAEVAPEADEDELTEVGETRGDQPIDED